MEEERDTVYIYEEGDKKKKGRIIRKEKEKE